MEIKLEEITQQAVQAALNNEWDKAIAFNRQILEALPDDIDALNRLAKSLAQNGQIKEAQKTYRYVLKLDPYNLIAQKNLKLALRAAVAGGTQIDPNLFIEEPGKTKTVFLVNTQKDNLKHLRVGDTVLFDCGREQVAVLTADGLVLGFLDNSFSQYFGKLVAMGNVYQAHIISFEEDKIGIFIREVKKSTKLNTVISFPTAGNHQYRSFLKDDLLALLSGQADNPETGAAEEFEEKADLDDDLSSGDEHAYDDDTDEDDEHDEENISLTMV